jgi:hypothetical protein
MYFTPYTPSAEVALQQLRRRVFVSGEYGWIHSFASAELPKSSSLPIRAVFSALRVVSLVSASLKRFWRLCVSAGSIESALERAAENGTHSILDIQRTGERPDLAVATPFPSMRVQEVFGTLQPSRQQIARAASFIQDRIPRWEAVYLPVYRDGTCVEWAFIGCSGD